MLKLALALLDIQLLFHKDEGEKASCKWGETEGLVTLSVGTKLGAIPELQRLQHSEGRKKGGRCDKGNFHYSAGWCGSTTGRGEEAAGLKAARGRSELTLGVTEMQKGAEQNGVGHGVGEPQNSRSERGARFSHTESPAMDWGLSRMQEQEVQGLGKKQPGRGLSARSQHSPLRAPGCSAVLRAISLPPTQWCFSLRKVAVG